MSLRFFQDGVSFQEQSIEAYKDTLGAYRAHLQEVIRQKNYDVPEASLVLAGDEAYLEAIKTAAYAYQSKYLKYVIVVGIGGSNLGTKAIYEALAGERLRQRKPTPELLFVETVSEVALQEVIKHIESITDPREVLVNVISKSGSTTETIACFETLFAYLADRFEQDAQHRVVVTTDEGSVLDGQARTYGCTVLHIPKNVGGRYSVFSAVGMFPLFLAGADVAGLLRGARAACDRVTSHDTQNDIAFSHAAITAQAAELKLSMLNVFFFVPEFELIGKWLRQLIGESLGKQFDRSGKEVRRGITPIVSIGSTDLHSVGQLYFAGPQDKLTSFVYAPSTQNVHTPDKPLLTMSVSLKGLSFNTIMEAIYEGTKEAYLQARLPFVETVLDAADTASIGEYLQTKMIETMYIGELWNINAFDQPGVEAYKTAAKARLEKHRR